MNFLNIEMDGFLSYYKTTQINFSEGNTLIIGKNNSGKSKLFDAFHWVLFDRVFDSQMEKWIESPADVSRMVLNQRLRKEKISERGVAEVSVTLQLEAEQYEDQIISIKRTNHYDFSNPQTEKVSSDLMFFTQNVIDLNDTHIYSSKEAEDCIAQLFPRCLRDFILFQGEAASELMKLANKNQNTIKNAIEEISRIKLFKQAAEIANTYQQTKEREINKAAALSKKNADDVKRYEAEIEEKSKQMDTLSGSIEDIDDQISTLSDQCEKLRASLSEHEEVLKLFQDQDKYKKEYKAAMAEIDSYKDLNKAISNTWIFYKVKNKLESFSSFYKSLEDLGQVPPPIPQTEIRASLKNHKCSLCGHDLAGDPICYSTVKAKENNDMIDRFGKTISHISFALDSKMSEINNVPDSIKNYTATMDVQTRAKNAAMQRLQDIQGRLKSIQISSADEQAKEKFEQNKSLLAKDETTLKSLKTKKFQTEGRIQQLQLEIDSARSKMRSITVTAESVSDDDKLKLAYASRLASCMKKLSSSIQDIAYSEIQSEANLFYHEMVKENSAIVGTIKIDRENSEIYTVNSYGDKILNLNTGNRILIELAVIAGILSVANRQFAVVYPFVTDAPTSQLDAANKMQTVKCMLTAFDQSIIIVKDDTHVDSKNNEESLDPLIALAKDSSEIGAAYQIVLTRDAGATEIEDQYSKINILKECDINGK